MHKSFYNSVLMVFAIINKIFLHTFVLLIIFLIKNNKFLRSDNICGIVRPFCFQLLSGSYHRHKCLVWFIRNKYLRICRLIFRRR